MNARPVDRVNSEFLNFMLQYAMIHFIIIQDIFSKEVRN